MTIYSQIKVNGILYTLRAVPTPDYPSKEIPYSDNLISQFKDIVENHSALALEKVERPAILATAAEQVREYEAETAPAA